MAATPPPPKERAKDRQTDGEIEGKQRITGANFGRGNSSVMVFPQFVPADTGTVPQITNE
jgi:hypothetical protein